MLFTAQSPPPPLPPPSLRSLGGYLFCLAELQELRLPSSEETLADAIGFTADIPAGEATATSSAPVIVTPSPNPSPLVSTWLHDEGHHSDVCELARDVLLVATAAATTAQESSSLTLALAPLWTSLFTCMVRHGHTKALVHSLSICDQKIAALFESPYLNTEIYQILSRVANDTATRIDQVAELLTTRQTLTADVGDTADKHSEPESDTTITSSTTTSPTPSNTMMKTHNVLLLSHTCSVGAEHWEFPPEDVALTAARVARCWVVLGRSRASFALDPSLVYASVEEKTRFKKEFLEAMKATSLHLLAAAQGMGGCALSGGSGDDDLALRDVLSVAAQQCAVASFGVLRNLAEKLHLQSPHPTAAPQLPNVDKWHGIVLFIGEHMVTFLASCLSSSLANIQSDSRTEESSLTTANSFRVLEALFTEFPDHIAVLFLNQLCKINVQVDVCEDEAPPVISKALLFDDDDDVGGEAAVTPAEDEGGGVAVQFIEEIIRCSAHASCSAAATAPSGTSKGRFGNDSFTQKGKIFSVIFNWIFNR
jgi:hypothetical protein